jgi:hypothetical protein
MITRLSSILQAENLEHLLQQFDDQGVTDSILSELSDADLKDLGIDKLGERKRLLVAFKGGATPETAAPIAAAAPPSVETPATPTTAATPAEATKESPFVNSLGMPFVPIPRFDTRFCIWPARVQDYEAYCVASGARFPSCPFPQDSDHPIVGVSWNDAIEFCVWLTGKERADGKIDGKTIYRLPTDLEWSAAVGLPHEPEPIPEMRHLKAPGYPWGLRWPPPKHAGNYEPARDDQLGILRVAHEVRGYPENSTWTAERYIGIGDALRIKHSEWKSEWQYPVDDFDFTSPVGSFSTNASGIYDLGGNVWEWCMDFLKIYGGLKVLRGGCYCAANDNPAHQKSVIGERRSLYGVADTFFPYHNKIIYQSSFRYGCAQGEYALTRFPTERTSVRATNQQSSDGLFEPLDDGNSHSFPINGIRLALVTDVS